MRDIHIRIDELIVEGASFDAAEFEATLAALAETHAGDFPSGAASVLAGTPVSRVTAAEVAHSVWHSMIPAGGGGTHAAP